MKMNTVGSPPSDRLGCDSDLLCTMIEVENNSLREGHMFSMDDIFWMRIGKEAILQNIHVQCIHSDNSNLMRCGPSFHVHGTFREGLGWTCLHCIKDPKKDHF